MIRYFQIRLKAQAMQFALLVAAMVALLLSAFIALTHIHSFFGIQSRELLELLENTNQKVLVAIEADHQEKDTITTSSGKMTTKTNIVYHGAWQKAYVVNQLRKKQVAKTALFGSQQTPKTPNLYLANNSAPLIVVGATRIEGASYLPKTGVRAGTIAGNYYQGTSLTYGSTHNSQKELPELDPEWRAYLQFLTSNEVLQNDSIQGIESNQKQSFLERKKILYSPTAITLSTRVQGNCVIKSALKIIVSATAILDDVLLVAPEIDFQEGFSGTVQALATKRIEVAKNVQLKYPSSLVVLKEVEKEEIPVNGRGESAITINTGATLQGSVVFLKKEIKEEVYAGVKNDIKIDTGAMVFGEVYCEGNTELLGSVKGSLYTEQFVANQYGSIYMNHIYNGKILKNPIERYSGLPFRNSSKTLAKWLY